MSYADTEAQMAPDGTMFIGILANDDDTALLAPTAHANLLNGVYAVLTICCI